MVISVAIMIFLVLFSKILAFFLRFSKLGGGTSFPGLLFEKISPSSLTHLASQYKQIVLISGTNGKTTTQQFLRHLLESKGTRVVSNISGANLFRGIAATIVCDTNIFGRVKSDVGVFEVEEATMPILTRFVRADFIVVTNLFRDQLDAYGEIVKTRSYIVKAINQSEKAKIFLNEDDKNVISIANETRNEILLFSVHDEMVKKIFYERGYFESEAWKRGQKFYAQKVSVGKDLSARFDIVGPKDVVRGLHFKSPGIQNVYNAIAAVAVATQIEDYSKDELKLAFSRFTPAFGRGENIRVNGKSIRLLLIKNPASFTANLIMLKHISNLKLMIIINDKIADGRDVSWLWDSNIELLKNKDIAWITVSGIRALDMALRLKYAQIHSLGTETEGNISKALDISLAKLRDGETLFVLPTYTAMLEVRKAIGNIVKIREFWK